MVPRVKTLLDLQKRVSQLSFGLLPGSEVKYGGSNVLVTRTTWDKPNYCPEVCKELDEPTDRIMVPGQFVEYMGPDRNVVEGFTLRKAGVGLCIDGHMQLGARVLSGLLLGKST